jgi:hypothetical protein
MVRVLGYRSGGPSSIPGTTRKKVVGLERFPLSLVSTNEELLDKKSSGSCLENRESGLRDPSRWPRGTLYPQKLAISSPTSGGRSVGIVRLQTQTMEFNYINIFTTWNDIWEAGATFEQLLSIWEPIRYILYFYYKHTYHCQHQGRTRTAGIDQYSPWVNIQLTVIV